MRKIVVTLLFLFLSIWLTCKKAIKSIFIINYLSLNFFFSVIINQLLFASRFLQEQRKKKNEMKTEEEKKMEYAIWKANIIV